jgi:hypothetical protein
LAIRLTVVPPAVVKSPPAYTFPPVSAVRAKTPPLIPVPSADHEVPFHLAIRLTDVPPAVVKYPPT